MMNQLHITVTRVCVCVRIYNVCVEVIKVIKYTRVMYNGTSGKGVGVMLRGSVVLVQVKKYRNADVSIRVCSSDRSEAAGVR